MYSKSGTNTIFYSPLQSICFFKRSSLKELSLGNCPLCDSQPNTEGQQTLQQNQFAISSQEISSQRALALNSRVLSLRGTCHVD